jgi:hypothetical protein
MQKILSKYEELKSTTSDINEHFDTLLKYGAECKTITELGVRGICSTWAFLASKPEKLISYDLKHPIFFGGNLEEVVEAANEAGIDFKFIEGDSTKIVLDNTDLLFIDTWHTYDQLSLELKLHSKNVNKYIVLHDTTNYEYQDETFHHVHAWEQPFQGGGLWKAIEEFLVRNRDWFLKERFINNNGLTILEKK